MAHCIKHTQCPECVKLGKDRSGDNLAVYSDGSEYCFNCGYYRKADGMQAIRKAAPRTDKPIQLPFDSTIELPQPVWEWLRQYSLTELDAQLHSIMWSEHWQRMILPIIIDGQLVAWQGRSFDPTNKAKWFSQGNIHEILYVIGNNKSNRVVLTEDFIKRSAFLVPLFNTQYDMFHESIRKTYDKLFRDEGMETAINNIMGNFMQSNFDIFSDMMMKTVMKYN